MVALVHPVYDCLLRLARPDALMNEEEVGVRWAYSLGAGAEVDRV